MFRGKTVFVLGAGASAEFKMPVGKVLRDKIAEGVRVEPPIPSGTLRDHELLSAVESRTGVPHSMAIGAAHRLSKGLALTSSIDDYLDLHRNDKTLLMLGKSEIVKSILEAERTSNLYVAANARGGFAFQSLDGTWLVHFMQMLGGKPAHEALENITFVSFNYDRVLEFFLFHALIALYSVGESAASSILSRVKIYHPYGSVGGITELHGSVPFGGILNPDEYVALSEQIRTYTEEVADERMVGVIRDEICHAETIVFLGFAFHRQNMELLTPVGGIGRQITIFSTAFGIKGDDQDTLRQILFELFHETIRGGTPTRPTFYVKDLTCAKFFDEFNLTLKRR